MDKADPKLPKTKCFVVSMTNAEERRRQFALQAETAAVDWAFFDACTELSTSLKYDPAQAEATFGRQLAKGELGCYSSHYTLWENLCASDADQYLIIEDDVIVDWDMAAILSQYDFAAQGIDYLRLFYKNPTSTILRQRGFGTSQHNLIEIFGWAWGTQAYFITKAGARAMIDACRTVEMPLDDQMDRSWVHGVPNLAVFPAPAMERAVPSQIEGQRGAEKSCNNATLQFRAGESKRAKSAYQRARLQRWFDRKFKR